MIETKLGKIKNAQFGFIPNGGFLMGLTLHFSLEGGSSGIGCGGKYTVNISKECKWDNEIEKRQALENVLARLAVLLKEAKVNHVSELIGKPVEVNIKDNTFYGFRILTEVL